MRANKAHFYSTLLVLTLLSADAMAQGAPALPPLPAAGPIINQTGQPTAQPLPGGQANLPQVGTSFGKELTYRDPSAPISINEVSELQAKKANADLYKKFGLSDVSPIKVTKEQQEKTDQAKSGKTLAAPIVRKLKIVTLSIWGRPNALQAEAVVDGALKKIRTGDTIVQGVIAKTISSSGIELEITELPKRKKRSSAVAMAASSAEVKPKIVSAVSHNKYIAKPATALPKKTQWAYVGRSAEMNL
jgi:hypothetical protein